MKKISRRKAITGIIGTSAAALSFSGDSLANTGQETSSLAFRGTHQIKPLPFKASKLKGISEKVIKSHWGKQLSWLCKSIKCSRATFSDSNKRKRCARLFVWRFETPGIDSNRLSRSPRTIFRKSWRQR